MSTTAQEYNTLDDTLERAELLQELSKNLSDFTRAVSVVDSMPVADTMRFMTLEEEFVYPHIRIYRKCVLAYLPNKTLQLYLDKDDPWVLRHVEKVEQKENVKEFHLNLDFGSKNGFLQLIQPKRTYPGKGSDGYPKVKRYRQRVFKFICKHADPRIRYLLCSAGCFTVHNYNLLIERPEFTQFSAWEIFAAHLIHNQDINYPSEDGNLEKIVDNNLPGISTSCSKFVRYTPKQLGFSRAMHYLVGIDPQGHNLLDKEPLDKQRRLLDENNVNDSRIVYNYKRYLPNTKFDGAKILPKTLAILERAERTFEKRTGRCFKLKTRVKGAREINHMLLSKKEENKSRQERKVGPRLLRFDMQSRLVVRGRPLVDKPGVHLVKTPKGLIWDLGPSLQVERTKEGYSITSSSEICIPETYFVDIGSRKGLSLVDGQRTYGLNKKHVLGLRNMKIGDAVLLKKTKEDEKTQKMRKALRSSNVHADEEFEQVTMVIKIDRKTGWVFLSPLL